MDALIYVASGLGLALLVGLVAAIFWLSKARKGQVEAELETNALRKGKELRREGNKIMAEPVADERAWLVAALERLQERARRKS